MAYIEGKDSSYIQEQFVEWLNTNLDDPYEQKTGNSRSCFVKGEGDTRVVSSYPKIQVTALDNSHNKVTYKKGDRLTQVEHNFTITYFNQNGHLYEFSDGTELKNIEQCRKYLRYILKQIKANETTFTFCHDITFGTIPLPVFNKASRSFVSYLPMTVYTYER